MTNLNEEYISPHWAGFNRIWWIGIIILIILLLLSLLAGYGPGRFGAGKNCHAPATTVEKIVEVPVEKIVEVEKIIEVEKIVEKIVEVPAAPVAAAVVPAPMAVPSAAKLYFENDSAEFPADTKLSLADVIAYLRNNEGAQAIISGFHSATGNFEHNQELSKQRAISVSQLLQESGVSVDRIVLEKPVETEGTGSEEEARRVEVSVR